MSTGTSNELNPGLSSATVAERLGQHGPNELPGSKSRSVWAAARDVAREPMFLLLLACGGIYLLLGDVGEALMLLGFVFVVLGITLYQERKTERALEALRDLSSPRALVVRDGQRKRVAGRDVVPGDILVISEGDRVPADSVVLESGSLAVDESLLTGESVPVRKTVWDGARAITRPGGEDLPFLFSGTLVVQGQGLARVLSTGLKTEMGNIGKALEGVTVEQTHLQREIGALVRRVALMGAGLCAVAVVLYGLTRGDWLQGVLAGITLAMAMLPEEFPVVLTIFLALGAWRLSRMQVLARRVPVIETLGSATVLCVDKTGTLTENRMAIRKLVVGENVLELPRQGVPELPEEVHEIVEFGILASQRDPFDPMEKAFHDLGNGSLADTEHLHADWKLAREYPLSPSLLAMSHVWKSPNGDDFALAAKGAPEAVADLCHLDHETIRGLNLQVSRMAEEGLRVLGVAKGIHRQERLPGEQHDFTFEFLGLVGLEDPLRESVPSAVAECHSAGMRVVMITGDHPSTARSIARQAGIAPLDLVVTGTEMERIPEAELLQKARQASVFARMVPEHKLRLVNALKANGEVVAMTGDGVNDAPALKSAHIGIAMGGRGTDVAREASSLVLLDDDFASIVRSVRMGRRIYDHLRKAMTYIIAVHVPIAGMSLIPVLLSGAPLALSPVHILFLELVIDPACSIVFEAEPENPDLMRRPPRSPAAPLFGAGMLLLGLAQGLSVLTGVLVVYLLGWLGGLSAGETTALSFVTLTLSNLGLIFVNRSWTRSIVSTLRVPNPALWAVCGATLFFLALVLFTPGLRGLFHFTPTAPARYLVCVAACILSLAWFEGLKRVWRWKKPG